MKPIKLLTLLLTLLAAIQSAPAAELYRIRARNQVGAPVQVSVDQGGTYWAVGRVRTAATTRILGFAASSYVPSGTVAATAVHGLRIKTGQTNPGKLGKAQEPLMFSLTPAEFSEIPRGYGGHRPGSSGIVTDIYTGHSVFRNFSPFVGNRVYIERDGRLQALPEDYTPVVGDTYVITVEPPARMPSAIAFENRAGGSVTAAYLDGTTASIAHVERPVKGVGRYDGTAFTGVGAVNTNHGGVLTLSTAPICPPGSHEGGPVETRGGFMVQPYYHVKEQGENAVQVMVIAPDDKSKPVLEGTPPLFSGHINLARFPDHPECSYRVEVKIDNGDWEPVPQIVGRVDDAFTPAYLKKLFAAKGVQREITEGVTAVRLLFPTPSPTLLASELKRESGNYTARAISSGVRPQKGLIGITPAKRMAGIVSFAVDGRRVYSASAPCTFNWETTAYPNGFHTVDIINEAGEITETRQILVKN